MITKLGGGGCAPLKTTVTVDSYKHTIHILLLLLKSATIKACFKQISKNTHKFKSTFKFDEIKTLTN